MADGRAAGATGQSDAPSPFLMALLGVMYFGAVITLARFFDSVFYLVTVWSGLGSGVGGAILAWLGAVLAAGVAIWATIALARAARAAGWLTTGALVSFGVGLVIAALVLGFGGDPWRTAMVVVAGCAALVFVTVSGRAAAFASRLL